MWVTIKLGVPFLGGVTRKTKVRSLFVRRGYSVYLRIRFIPKYDAYSSYSPIFLMTSQMIIR